MNTRILRMCRRNPISRQRSRIVQGLGQMQPVIFGIEHGVPTLRIEGVTARGESCWRVIPLRAYRKEAKAAFAELEACRRENRKSPSWRAWDEQNSRRSQPERPRAMAAGGGDPPAAPGFGD